MSDIDPAFVASMRRELDALAERIAARDTDEFTPRIEAALKAAGVKITAPDAAKAIIAHAAASAPTDPAAAAEALVKTFPMVFTADPAAGAPGAELARLGVIPRAAPTREQRNADAAAGADAATATPEQREAFLRSKGYF